MQVLIATHSLNDAAALAIDTACNLVQLVKETGWKDVNKEAIGDSEAGEDIIDLTVVIIGTIETKACFNKEAVTKPKQNQVNIQVGLDIHFRNANRKVQGLRTSTVCNEITFIAG